MFEGKEKSQRPSIPTTKVRTFFDMSKFILVFVVAFWRISFHHQHGARLPRAF